MPRTPGLLLIVSLAAGCYGFGGGTGFPPEIRTVAVLPFENLTAEPNLTNEVIRAVRDAVQGRLGLKPAGEALADAIVTGTIDRYEPDIPVAFSGGEGQNVDVTRRKVQLVVTVTIRDQRADKVLWERRGIMVEGDYTSNESDGRQKAIEQLTKDIVDGAQSQW